EDAQIIIAGGRGVGKDGFDSVLQLADCLGGSVGVTRPVVDWNLVPFDRQIGQTGKTVSPELIVNCGISGANEYTAGMEKSKHVIAINVDPRSRIFDFADLGAVGDLQEILPLLNDRLRNLKKDEG
ncbi:MAG: electron transfer flavoprotein subunit alpha/FixB family protein, partial [Proteobacteria bacterium]|nr:electron transfer flavoprotein subunit alpha/FixB family protein [Pseudomonadota bacterium]